MAFQRRSDRQQQVRLTVFNNEPLARMAEQRLAQEGIPCVVKSLGAGPALWGTAYYLPHGVYVFDRDEMRAREVLELPPREIAERESCPESSEGVSSFSWWIQGIALLTIILLAGLLLFIFLKQLV